MTRNHNYLGALALLLCLGISRGEAQEALTLRVADSETEVGGVAVVVIRTYAPRPVTQGQLCFRLRRTLRRGASQPLLTLEEARVFSSNGVISPDIQILDDGATVMLEFTSGAADVNESDGPLAALFLRAGDALMAGDEVEVELDLAATTLSDGVGAPIPVEGRGGRLRVVPVGSALQWEIGSATVPAGQTGLVEISTQRSLPLGAATLSVEYVTTHLRDLPTARLLRDHGDANMVVSHPSPGVMDIDLDSPGMNLNEVPGDLVELQLPTDSSVVGGTLSAIGWRVAESSAEDAGGLEVDLAFEDGQLEILASAVIFMDAFESGDLSAWP